LSRFLPANPSGRSIYDDLRAHDGADDSDADVEERAGMAIDEENLGYHDDDLRVDLFNGEDSQITTESNAFLPGQRNNQTQGRARSRPKKSDSRWAQSPRLLEEEPDDDVPASLLIEDNEGPARSSPTQARSTGAKGKRRQEPIPGPSNRETRAHWEAAQAQQRLHREEEERVPDRRPEPAAKLLTGTPYDKAMWRWINVVNLDSFILQVYDYYTGSGVWCILLSRVLGLL
jgi:autophagy-related protein 9